MEWYGLSCKSKSTMTSYNGHKIRILWMDLFFLPVFFVIANSHFAIIRIFSVRFFQSRVVDRLVFCSWFPNCFLFKRLLSNCLSILNVLATCLRLNLFSWILFQACFFKILVTIYGFAFFWCTRGIMVK